MFPCPNIAPVPLGFSPAGGEGLGTGLACVGLLLAVAMVGLALRRGKWVVPLLRRPAVPVDRVVGEVAA